MKRVELEIGDYISGIKIPWVNNPIDAKVVLEYPTYYVLQRETPEGGIYRFCIQKADQLKDGDNERVGIYTY